MLFDLLRRLCRRERPFLIDDQSWQATVASFPFLSFLSSQEKTRLRRLTQDFLSEKSFSAAGGLDLTDDICICIAAQGCLPILELGLQHYRGWLGIIVYPDEFVVSRRHEDEYGVVHEFDDVLSGEAWPGGPLILSWQDARLAGDGYNVVIHEFAHKLDMQNGEIDGIPALPPDINHQEWETVLGQSYEHFCQRIDQGEVTRIDPYAAENPAEFFAVFSESFFEIPATIQEEYAEFYQLLVRYYRQNPAARNRARL